MWIVPCRDLDSCTWWGLFLTASPYLRGPRLVQSRLPLGGRKKNPQQAVGLNPVPKEEEVLEETVQTISTMLRRNKRSLLSCFINKTISLASANLVSVGHCLVYECKALYRFALMTWH